MESRSAVLGGVSLAVALIVAASGCSKSPVGTKVLSGHHAALQSTAGTMAGSWNEFARGGLSVPRGISMHMSLTASDTSLSGSGTYSTSSGSGTANVTGYIFWQDSMWVPAGFIEPAHPVVVLDLGLDDGLSVHIDQAVLLEPDTLSGVMVFSDDASHAWGALFARVAQ